MLAAVRAWPQGSWSAKMTIDGYDAPITLAATLTLSKSGVDVDFTGTSAIYWFAVALIEVPVSIHSSVVTGSLTGDGGVVLILVARLVDFVSLVGH